MELLRIWKLRVVVPVIAAMLTQSNSHSQDQSTSVIAGIVRESATAQGIEDAIVYLANTSFATFTTPDGRFRIAEVPEGEYKLIATRIGYRQQVIALHIVASESLYFEITMEQQPVRSGEVNVSGEQPARLNNEPPRAFFPQESPQTYCIFGELASIPIGIFFADSALYMYALDTAIVGSKECVRLWLLYQNLSLSPCLLDPWQSVRMHLDRRENAHPPILPASLESISGGIDTISLMKRTMEQIEKPLRSMAVVRTKFIREFERFESRATLTAGAVQINHNSPFDVPPANDGTLSPRLYRLLHTSVQVGLLRQYIVNPMACVSGFLYFPIPTDSISAEESHPRGTYNGSYIIEIVTQRERKFINFVPG